MSIQWVYPSRNNIYGGMLIKEKAVRRLSLNAGVIFENHLKATVSSAIHLSSGILYADGYFVEIEAKTFTDIPQFFVIGVNIEKDQLDHITSAELSIYDCSNNTAPAGTVVLYYGSNLSGPGIVLRDARKIIGLDAITHSKYREAFLLTDIQNLRAVFSYSVPHGYKVKTQISQDGNAIVLNNFCFFTLEVFLGVSNTNAVEATFYLSNTQITKVSITNGYGVTGIIYSGLARPGDYISLFFSSQPIFSGTPLVYITTYEIGGAYGF